MITVVLTNRNREIYLIERCLKSLKAQANKDFKCIVVDYGSRTEELLNLKYVLTNYPDIQFITCNTSKQLWCKSRAINIALKTCKTPWFFVGDIDMIFHPDFIENLYHLKDNSEVVYFQVGFLNKQESLIDRAFDAYRVSFKSNSEATGMTLYKTDVLKSLNGYDEFYHGWGGEDTDVHVRLDNANVKVDFYDKKLLMLHQWHPKAYRSKESLEPYHDDLELINHRYLAYTKLNGTSIANTKFEWGQYNEKECEVLKNPTKYFEITNEVADIKGFVNSILLHLNDEVVKLTIRHHPEYKTLKNSAKKILNKKVKTFLPMQEVNNLILETVIGNFRNSAYEYSFNIDLSQIELIIKC